MGGGAPAADRLARRGALKRPSGFVSGSRGGLETGASDPSDLEGCDLGAANALRAAEEGRRKMLLVLLDRGASHAEGASGQVADRAADHLRSPDVFRVQCVLSGA
jgi:hypothetical protein